MRCLSFAPMLILCCVFSTAQGQGSLGGVGENNGKYASQLLLSDKYGRPVKPQQADVTGSPFFTPDYHFADIQLVGGRRFKSVKMRLDMDANEMHFISDSGIESYMEAGSVKEIAYADTAVVITNRLFRTGYPAIEGKRETFFYQVLVSGKADLLHAVEKKISERKDEISGIVSKEYETREEYYLFVGGEMKRLKKDQNFLLNTMSDQRAALEQYIRSNKLNMKNLQDIEKLVVYYNSL